MSWGCEPFETKVRNVDFDNTIREMIIRDLRWSGSASELTSSYPLLDNGAIDSQGIYQLVVLLEERYDVEIDDDDLVPENFETIADIAALVASKRE